MVTWQVAGSATDLTEPVHKTLRDFIVAHWTETNPPAASIRFKLDWYVGYGSYQIHFKDSQTPVSVITLGFGYREYKEYVNIHIFVRTNVTQEPVQRDNIKKEIQRIVSDYKDQLVLAGQVKTSYMEVMNMVNENQSSEEANIWHTIITVCIVYWKIAGP